MLINVVFVQVKCGEVEKNGPSGEESTLDSRPHFVLMIDALHPVARIKYHLPGVEWSVSARAHARAFNAVLLR